MSKAEELSQNRYPTLAEKYAFIEGYRQAEKDLELTWEDMECIIKHYQDIMAEKSRVFVRVEDYEELLKRYKDYKERKEK